MIKVGDLILGEKEKKALNEVINSGRISEGRKVNEFENKFAKFIGSKYCVLTNSGTSALVSGLSYFKQEQSFKKVITTPLTYIATSNAIINSGLKPVYVDIEEDSFNIDLEKIKELVEFKDYAGILPVHLMGFPCDMKNIKKITDDEYMFLLEDSSQAHGTKGINISDISAFSFYIAHNIQAGEMGAITTDDKKVYEFIKRFKSNGRICDCSICTRGKGTCPKREKSYDPRFTHDLIGYNFRTTEFSAALGLTQLEDYNSILKTRQRNVKRLNKGLNQFKGMMKLPKFSEEVSYLAYPLISKDRDNICKELEKKGIETRPLFNCIPTQQPAYSFLKKEYKNKLPNAERIGREGFYIGCHQYISSEEIDHIIKTFEDVLK